MGDQNTDARFQTQPFLASILAGSSARGSSLALFLKKTITCYMHKGIFHCLDTGWTLFYFVAVASDLSGLRPNDESSAPTPQKPNCRNSRCISRRRGRNSSSVLISVLSAR